ncbi:MAG TPA: HD domain-containing phosphohydrolase, partial [Vicinamibacterales bacterium]
YDVIKTHPTVGSRILQNVSFLQPHLPIVELHHERPDGGGYPYGLKGNEIPVLARIVHVADAYDAITSARAYRPARPAAEGLRELQRCAGTDFDEESVHALTAVLADGFVAADAVRGSLTDLPSERPRQNPRPTASQPDPLAEFASEGQVA